MSKENNLFKPSGHTECEGKTLAELSLNIVESSVLSSLVFQSYGRKIFNIVEFSGSFTPA